MERSEELPRWRGRSGSRRDAMSFCFPAGHRTPWSPPMCVISRTHSGPRSVLPRFIHSPARKSPATAIVRSSSPHISFDTFITSAFPTMPGRLSPFLLLPRTLRPPNRSFPFVRDSGGFFFSIFFLPPSFHVDAVAASTYSCPARKLSPASLDPALCHRRPSANRRQSLGETFELDLSFVARNYSTIVRHGIIFLRSPVVTSSVTILVF